MSETAPANEDTVRCTGCKSLFEADQVVRLGGRPFCADCKEEHIQDVRSGSTAESTELASIGSRFVALILDGLIMLIPALGLGMILGLVLLNNPESVESPLFNIITQVVGALPFLLYEGLMLANAGGQTLGKKAMNIVVVHSDGSALVPGSAWKRAGGRWIFSVVPLLGLVDLLWALGKRRRTLHDLIGNTKVLKRR